MDNETILLLARALATRGWDDAAGLGPVEENEIGPNKPDYSSLFRLSMLPHITTQQAILTAKRLVKYSDTQLPQIATELGLHFSRKELLDFSRRPVSDTPIISVMRYEDRYGPRIALHMPYDAEAQAELKKRLPFPQSKFERGLKVWTIVDDEGIIETATDILQAYGYDFSPWLLTDPESLLDADALGIDLESRGVPVKTGDTPPTPGRGEIRVRLKGDSLVLNWPYIPDAELRDTVRIKVKSIPGRRFDPDAKHWTIPLSHGHTLYKELETVYAPLAKALAGVPEVSSYLDGALKRVALSQAADLDDEEVRESIRKRLTGMFPEGRALYPFQFAGVAFIELADGRCLLGDDMGIGKTIQALAYAALHQEQWPVVVVCPANVKYNWAREIGVWLPDATCSVVKNGKDEFEPADFVIINYDLMWKQLDRLHPLGFGTAIIDESHYLKNSDTKRSQATLALAQTCESILCLSGTAITNRPVEFFTTLNLLRPSQFPNFFQYARRYCNAYHNGYGWDFTGASNTKELNERIRDFGIRRLKTEVLPELPPKTRTFLPIHLKGDERKEYEQSRLDWMGQYEHYQTSDEPMPKGFVLNMLTDLRHVCGRMKVGATVDWVKEYHHQTGKPVVVYVHHRDVAANVADSLRESGLTVETITGETSAEKRADIVQAFQEGESDVLVCNTLAAKEGITLTAADTVVFVEREWVPGWEEQAEDRVLRIGQESDNVLAIYLSCVGTIDEHFDRVIEEKREIVKAVLDGGEGEERKGIVAALLNKLVKHEGFPEIVITD